MVKLRTFLVISVACLFAGALYLGTMLGRAYFPAYTYVDLVSRYYKIFVALFLSIAVLEIIRAFRTRWHRKSYFGAQAFIDLALGVLVLFSFFAGKIELESTKVVTLGNQKFKFSSLDYPLANKSWHNATPLFALDEDHTVHSVYLALQTDYDFENIFSDTYARGFFFAIHAPNSPNLDEFKIQPKDITLNRGSVLIDEGQYILEFFTSSRLGQDENLRFLKFIKDNISEIRKDIRAHKVVELR